MLLSESIILQSQKCCVCIFCEEVDIHGVRILNNRMMANCDGIDPDHCKHVRITNCHIEAADDCIVLKTTEANSQYGDCEDILISNCTLASTSAAIKIGTESVNDFRNIVVTGCSIYDTNRGISFQLRDQGNIENVLISNCMIQTRNSSECWWGCAEPVNITTINRRDDIPSGKIRGLSLTNLRCIGEGSIYIAGKDSSPIEDLTLDNIRLTLEKNSKYPIKGYDFRPCSGPSFQEGKIHGIYVKNAKDVTVRNIKVTVQEEMQEWVDRDICFENAVVNE